MSNQITYTETEFCRVVGISRATAWRERNKGKLHYCLIGGKILYTQKHIDDFLKACEVNGLPEAERAVTGESR